MPERHVFEHWGRPSEAFLRGQLADLTRRARRRSIEESELEQLHAGVLRRLNGDGRAGQLLQRLGKRGLWIVERYGSDRPFDPLIIADQRWASQRLAETYTLFMGADPHREIRNFADEIMARMAKDLSRVSSVAESQPMPEELEARMELGRRLRHWREVRHLTQKELGNTYPCDFAESSIRRWESGETMPMKKNIRALAKALKIKPEDLTG